MRINPVSFNEIRQIFEIQINNNVANLKITNKEKVWQTTKNAQ
jgi:hypothetical protein